MKKSRNLLAIKLRLSKNAKLFAASILAVFALLSAGDHVARIARHLLHHERLETWQLIVDICGALFMIFLTISVILALLTSARLFRAQRKRRAG